MKKIVLAIALLFAGVSVFAQTESSSECLPASVYNDTLFNTDVAKVIYNKFAMSNSPVFKGTYLRHVAVSEFHEYKKDGKVAGREMSFTVAKKNEKGKCVLVKVKIRQEALPEGKGWGKPFVDGAVPQSGTVDCDCVLKNHNWYKP